MRRNVFCASIVVLLAQHDIMSNAIKLNQEDVQEDDIGLAQSSLEMLGALASMAGPAMAAAGGAPPGGDTGAAAGGDAGGHGKKKGPANIVVIDQSRSAFSGGGMGGMVGSGITSSISGVLARAFGFDTTKI